MDIVNDAWAIGVIIAFILIALAFGGWRTGWFSGQRTDAGNLQAQRGEGESAQDGQQRRGWPGGAHSRPDDITRGV